MTYSELFFSKPSPDLERARQDRPHLHPRPVRGSHSESEEPTQTQSTSGIIITVLDIWAVHVSHVLERQQHCLMCSQCQPTDACTRWRRGGRRNADCQLEPCGFWLLSWSFPVFVETHGHHGHASSFRLVELCNWCRCSIAR